MELEFEPFPTIPLSQTTKFIVDNRGKTAPTAVEGIPLIATNCIDNRELYPSYKNIRYVSQETYETWFRSHPEPNDIILTLKGSQNGATCLVPSPVSFVIAQDMVALRVDKTVMDYSFLLAALRSDDVQSEIKNLDVSGVIPHLKKTDFDKLRLPYPPLPVQQIIGKLYLDFCLKIDLLHRQNNTLEAMAETLFRQWFVEEASDDWRYAQLGSFVACFNGVSYKSEHLVPSENALVTLKNFDRNGGFKSDGYKAYSGKYKDTQVVEPGELVVAHTDITQDAAVVGNPILVERSSEFKKLVVSMDLVKVTPSTSELSTEFIYYLMRTRLFKQHCVGLANGSTVLHLSKEAIPTFEFFLPTPKKIKRFTLDAKDLRRKLQHNKVQIATLEKLRDALLPKLMSGEVRVQYE